MFCGVWDIRNVRFVQICPDSSRLVSISSWFFFLLPAFVRHILVVRQAACKPGSVPDGTSCVARRVAIIHLGRRFPAASCDLPGGGPGRAIASLFGLAPGGACSAGRSPDRWCALTAPSHPCRRPRPRETRPERVGGMFLCAFRQLALPGSYPAPCPAEPGLSSTSSQVRPGQRPRPPGGLATFTVARFRATTGPGPRWPWRRRAG